MTTTTGPYYKAWQSKHDGTMRLAVFDVTAEQRDLIVKHYKDSEPIYGGLYIGEFKGYATEIRKLSALLAVSIRVDTVMRWA